MNVFFYGNTEKDKNAEIGGSIISSLNELGFSVYIDQIEYSKFNAAMIGNDFKILDFSIILGGDGTIIHYARIYSKHNIPFLGINLGRVGALALTELEDYYDYLKKIKEGNYRIENRMVLDGQIIRSNDEVINFMAYNDITVDRYKSLKMLGMSVKINDSNENKFYADGVVIATPTGSSAYNLSCGGPLLLPTTKCYVLTPICPQFKAFSPVVIDDCHTISLSILGHNEARIGIDGCESYEVNSKDIININKSYHTLKVICFNYTNELFGSLYKVAMAINKK